MREALNLRDSVRATMERTRRSGELMELNGIYRFKHWSGGVLKRDVVNHNVVTSEGKKHLLDIAINNSGAGGTLQTTWYVMLVSNDGPPPTPAITHVYDTFAGTDVVEFTEYAGAVRKTFVSAVLSVARISNASSRASFTFATPTKDVYGAALVSSDVKGDSTAGDILMSWAALPDGVITPGDGDILNIEIELAFTS